MLRLIVLLLSLGLVWAGPATEAEAKKRRRRVVHQQYVIPFTCGNNAADTSGALPGDYAIAIDVLNGGATDVTLDEQVHLTFPPGGQMPGYVSDVLTQTLAGETALQISCDDLTGAAFVYPNPPPATTYVQGLLLITASSPVHVSATRTSQGAAGDLSVETEKVEPMPVAPVADDPAGQMTICHVPPGNPAAAHTITVGVPSWPAHQGHGDTQGVCP